MVKQVSAAIFDIDHTLTRHATPIRCVLSNLSGGQIPLKFCFSIVRPYFNYKKGKMNLDNCDNLVEGMEGIGKEELMAMGRSSFEKYHKKDLYRDMVDLIHDYKKAGIPVILATSSPRFVVQSYYDYLEADHLICTELDFNEDDIFTGKFRGTVAFDKGKQILLEAYIRENGYDPAKCAFYTDSIHDLHTMEMVGHPVAVNPDGRLRKRALKSSWDIIDCR
ncbi:MAG: HAD-IB family hydrolase [Spirochaetales bacterium]|nr:HAD-IB family hydrolase [Spirochaetales bacterium]